MLQSLFNLSCDLLLMAGSQPSFTQHQPVTPLWLRICHQPPHQAHESFYTRVKSRNKIEVCWPTMGKLVWVKVWILITRSRLEERLIKGWATRTVGPGLHLWFLRICRFQRQKENGLKVLHHTLLWGRDSYQGVSLFWAIVWNVATIIFVV